MDSFVAMLAVAAWLLLMIPAAFVLFVGNPGGDTDERPTLMLVAPAETAAEIADRPAA